MSHDTGSPVATRRRRITEALKLAVAGAIGFALAPGMRERNPLPASATAISDARPAKHLHRPAGKPAPAHLNTAFRIADALDLARTDIDALRLRLSQSQDQQERLVLIRGLFAHFADSLPPRDAISQALQFAPYEQEAALRELAGVWLGVGPETLVGGEKGASAVLRGGLALIHSDKARSGTAEAWVSAFRDHPARLELASAFAGMLTVHDPHRALAMADGFTEWERRRFYANVVPAWAGHDPDAARRWQADPANGATEADRQRFWSAVTYNQPEWADKALASERDPAARLDAVRGIASVKANQGTLEAVAWADSLADRAERELAHEIIYEATPRGIGAALGTSDGYPEIREALPGGAAAAAGLQRGDRIVEVTGADGKTVSLYNQPIEATVKQLQGEAGERISLRILRSGPDGRPVEQTVNVVRSQIVLPPVTARKEW
jgi:hypothetical protein